MRGPVGLPADPKPFIRGNSIVQGTNIRKDPTPGFYFNLWRFGFVIGLFLLWTWSTQWIDNDARSLRMGGEFWNGLALLGGALGFAMVLSVPSYAVGFLLMTATYAGPLGWYVYTRNQRVPEGARVLTPQHLRFVAIRTLGRLGIVIGTSREARDSALGPPIRFVGKSISGRGEDDSRSRQAEKSKHYLAAKEMIYDAILRRATDVHLEPKIDELSVRYRIDGVMYPAEPFDRGVGDAIINIFKVLGAMDITEKRKPQDGSFRADLEGRMIDFRVATQGTRDGEKMSLRILDQKNSVSKLSDLGMRRAMQEQIREILHLPHGMFIVCGPTGAGKSTTLYASLSEIDAMQVNIITVEDPVEYKIENVTQIEVNEKAGNTFATALRSILRQDPDVVMIGEMRDNETAKIACQAATTGHLVFSTVHANDTITALFRLLDLGIEPFLLSSSVSAILGQRLVRKLCPDCREPYKPKAELLKQARLPPEKIEAFYRPPQNLDSGCPTCGGLGYKGRMGVYELFLLTDRIRDMVREGATMSAIKAEARKNGMQYMKEEGLRLVVKGLTSIQELNENVK
jgi:type II secretory ATPase GspE/PulE/Tfp pilus assembly ATPase PilB-like protein